MILLKGWVPGHYYEETSNMHFKCCDECRDHFFNFLNYALYAMVMKFPEHSVAILK